MAIHNNSRKTSQGVRFTAQNLSISLHIHLVPVIVSNLVSLSLPLPLPLSRPRPRPRARVCVTSAASRMPFIETRICEYVVCQLQKSEEGEQKPNDICYLQTALWSQKNFDQIQKKARNDY